MKFICRKGFWIGLALFVVGSLWFWFDFSSSTAFTGLFGPKYFAYLFGIASISLLFIFERMNQSERGKKALFVIASVATAMALYYLAETIADLY